MKYYLSSHGFGNCSDRLFGLLPESNKTIGYVPNAMDFSGADSEQRATSVREQMEQLRELGIEPELLDLQDDFGRQATLREKLEHMGGVWVRGGNVFVLRQAMRLSGFDRLMHEFRQRDDFLYAGYSAGVCVLAPDLQALQIVDDATEMPYVGLHETIWEGLGLLGYVILPHYDSDHPESAAIDQAIEYCEQHNIPNRPLRDGEVIVIE